MITAEELKSKIIYKGVRNVRRGITEEQGTNQAMYRREVTLDLERSRLLTEAYKMTENEPIVIRRAKSLKHILSNMTIYIQKHERIVGNYAASPGGLMMAIETNWKAYERMVTIGDAQSLLDDEGRSELKEICKYWAGKTLRDKQNRAFKGCEDLEKYWKYEGTFLWTHWYGLGIPNYEKLFKIGLKGIRAEAEAKLIDIKTIIPFDYLEQKDFLESVIITLKAAITWAHRYAEKARELAMKEKSLERKKQLEEIAATCDWVPENPPRTFREAIQSFWFIHIITRAIEFVSSGIGIRFDLLTGPFYKKDLEEGRIDRDNALDLMMRLWAMFEGVGKIRMQTAAGIYGGSGVIDVMTIGGVDKYGNDVTNEVTYLVLDTAEKMKTIQPSLALRIHNGTPIELLQRASDVIGTGIGYPSLFNDEVLIPLLQRWKATQQEARDYGMSGCVYIEIPGKNSVRRVIGYFSVLKCLWWALYQGVNPKTGEQYGARTPDPTTFTSVENIIQAFLEQVEFFLRKMFALEQVTRTVYEQYLPRPFTSALINGCIERGLDMERFKDPDDETSNFVIGSGQTNVADSIAAIKKFVFDDKKISMRELIEILDKNWEGKEDLRQMMLTRAPKFGNDDDSVDLIATDIHLKIEEIIERIHDKFGARCHFDGSAVSYAYSAGLDCPATPDSRKDGDPLADASLSPMIGRDTKGPTAVLKSCSKIEGVQAYNQLLNQRFLPSMFQGENRDKFVNYLRSWCDLKIPHVQFNVVDSDILRDAQKNPEKYTNLIVRVAGYSAYFVDLSKGLQDNIIDRTEQSL
jgi:choline trimethylamine-lyase